MEDDLGTGCVYSRYLTREGGDDVLVSLGRLMGFLHFSLGMMTTLKIGPWD